MALTKKQAAKLRGLIQAFTEDKVTLSHASESEVLAGGLDENLRLSKEKMLAFIRELTKDDNSK